MEVFDLPVLTMLAFRLRAIVVLCIDGALGLYNVAYGIWLVNRRIAGTKLLQCPFPYTVQHLLRTRMPAYNYWLLKRHVGY